ncbi:hypothetical protein [Labilibacter marinus]|uniref:hypothetical protein n=1 Tax=Labilibacter marinus TaxID=1477105 RepID=UPI00082F0752|nr:hypothetical protein [Labilibacter marinus]
MKNLNIYILLVALLGFVACEDDYEAPYPVNDVTWYTSMPNVTEYRIFQEDMMAFIDASQNPISHEWIIEEGSYFLTSDVKQGDSLHLFIDEAQGLTSDASGINVYFSESGRKSVRLRNTFTEKVTYDGARKLEAKQEGDVWVIDTTFTVDVYGPILPAYKVCRVVVNPDGSISDGEVLLTIGADDEPNIEESDTWPSVEVEVGERLRFVDLTVDEHPEFIQPDTRTWTIRNGSDPAVTTDSAANVYFSTYQYETVGLGNIISKRSASEGRYVQAQKIIPLKLKVVQSSQPFSYADGAVWTGQTELALNVTGEVASLGTNPEAGFTVHVVNTSKGVDKDIAVTAVSVDASNATRMNLTLAEAIYGDDQITVSFDATGTDIVSVDERPFVSFTDASVEIPVGGDNELTDNGAHSGYETGGAGLNKAFCPQYWVGGQDAVNPEWARVENMQFEGEASMKYNGTLTPVRPNLGWMQMQQSVDLAPGAYEVSHKIYIEPESTIKTIRSYVSPKTGSWPTEVSFVWDLSNVQQGEWVTIKSIASFPNQIGGSSAEQYRYQFTVSAADNPGVVATDVQTFYLDDMSIVKIDAGIRP